MSLEPELAERAIERRIARQLGMSATEAAAAIRQAIDAHMGGVISKELYLKGLDVRDFSLFAYGGAGPLHCCDYVRHINPDMDCYTFLYSSVFCALGAATMDLRHLYDRSSHLRLCDQTSDVWLDDFHEFNTVVARLRLEAERDLLSEGVKLDEISYSLDLDMRYGGQHHVIRVRAPALDIDDHADVLQLGKAFTDEYVRRYSAVSLDPFATIEIESFHLAATVPRAKPVLPELPQGSTKPSEAVVSTRAAYWPAQGLWQESTVYDASRLKANNVVEGPAIVQADDTTILVPPDRVMSVDRIGTAVLRRV